MTCDCAHTALQLPVTRVLLNNGADVAATTDGSVTALGLAVLAGGRARVQHKVQRDTQPRTSGDREESACCWRRR